MPRIIFDLTTLVRAGTRNDGICRTVRELAKRASKQWDGTTFAVYDMSSRSFFEIKDLWVHQILDGVMVDLSLEEPPAKGPGASIRRFLRNPRKQIFIALERIRLQQERHSASVALLQSFLMSRKYKARLFDKRGNRLPLVPLGMIVGRKIDLADDDIVLETGSDWPALRQLSEKFRPDRGPRLVVLCYDILPLLFPHFFPSTAVDLFGACFKALFPAASLVMFISECARSDAQAYCARHTIPLNNTSVLRLGANLPSSAVSAGKQLPSFLTKGRYALLVSTVEPRKGHAMILRVWKRLLSERIPQNADFKLVFVGAKGWLVDKLVAEMEDLDGATSNFSWVSDADDGLLAQLYTDAAFCVYPSIYEGYGLPVVEAFLHGKAVLASSGGAVPEAAGEFAPCIDPNDDEAWYRYLKSWIEDPAERRSFEQRIRDGYTPQTWDKSADDLLTAIRSSQRTEPSTP